MLMKDLFSVLEVAKLLDMSHSGVLYHIKNGSLKSTQVGKIYIITKEDFADFLKEKKKEKKINPMSLYSFKS
jgi:excisionase family DNA binding protein